MKKITTIFTAVLITVVITVVGGCRQTGDSAEARKMFADPGRDYSSGQRNRKTILCPLDRSTGKRRTVPFQKYGFVK